MRLIDANELTDRLNHTTMVAYPNLFPGLLAAVEVVDDSPTVDAVEVVHGRWIKSESMVRSAKCSNCKGWVTKHSVDEADFRFCPNCGAKMDGDGNDL